MPIPVFFHDEQHTHKPTYEWAFGDKLNHPETSHRAEKILAALTADPSMFSIRPPSDMPLDALRKIHDPALISLIERSETLPEGDDRRRAFGLLYGANTLGAVTGCVASTFFLLERLGTRSTLWSACALNAVVALSAAAIA